MSKKVWIPIFAALLFALAAGAWIYTSAAAQGRFPPADRRKLPGILGQVTAVTADQFTIQTRAGQERTFRIDENTRFTDPERQELSSGDLHTGGWVIVIAARLKGDGPLARAVVILPEDFDPENWGGVRGRVAQVDAAGNAFSVEGKDGQMTTVKVDANTRYRGQVSGLADLQVGMLAQVVTEEQANGDLLARTIRAGYPLVRRAGEVVSVDPAAGQFVIKTARQGEALTIAVDAETRFRSKDQTVQSLEDLQPGMIAVVSAEKRGEGALLARLVAVGKKESLPEFDQRFLGRVTAIADRSFSIKTRRGEVVTFQVTEETRFRSRGGVIDGLEDLKQGMPVVVGAKDLGDGQYQALMVLASPGRIK